MQEPTSSSDLVAAATGALRGGGTSMQDLLAGVQQRAQERARDELHRTVGVRPAGAPSSNSTDPRRALERLRRSHEELARKVSDLERRADRSLVELLQGLRGLEHRLSRANLQARVFQAQARSVTKVAVRQRQALKALKVTERTQRLTSVVNSLQAAAYGQKGSILSTNNLLLAGNQLLWEFIDPLLRKTRLVDRTTASLVARLAPLGTLLTGHAALGNRQHVRFISGVVTIPADGRVAFDNPRAQIADSLWPEFQRRTDVPVTAVAIDPDPGGIFVGQVTRGLVRIERFDGGSIVFSTIARPIRVAWMVDTGEDVG